MAQPISTLLTQLAQVTQVPPSVLGVPNIVFERDHPTDSFGSQGVNTSLPQSALFGSPINAPSELNIFNFHYNPSSFSSSTQWDTSIPLPSSSTQAAGAGGAVVDPLQGLPNVPESFSFEILLNRMVESSLSYNNTQAALFQTFGTLVDLTLLYRVINGLSVADVNAILAAPPSATMPPTDLGWLTGSQLTLLLGVGNMSVGGFITGLSVTHAKFLNTMTPVLTTIEVQMQRTLASGDAAAANVNDGGGGELPLPTDPTTGVASKGALRSPITGALEAPLPTKPRKGLHGH